LDASKLVTIAYIRVSTDKQEEKSQKHIITEWIGQHQIEIDKWLMDTVSGSVPWEKRSLKGAIDVLGEGDQIIVSEVSRIARSTIGVLTFLQACTEKKIKVVAIRTGITLDNSMSSKILVTVMAMAAEIERDLIRERTKGALAARKAKGLPVGRHHGSKNKNKKLDPHKDRIKELIGFGVSLAAIARIFQVSRQTVCNYIAEEGLMVGKRNGNGIAAAPEI